MSAELVSKVLPREVFADIGELVTKTTKTLASLCPCICITAELRVHALLHQIQDKPCITAEFTAHQRRNDEGLTAIE
jgi:hypothetical protein